MAGRCRGLCITKYKPDHNFGEDRFDKGQRYCTNDCDGKFIMWDGVFCPCCTFRLRCTPMKKKKTGKNQCVECGTRNSNRGCTVLWFTDKDGKKKCHKCYLKNHSLNCTNCNKEIFENQNKKNMKVTLEGKIICTKCYSLIHNNKSKKLEISIRKGMQALFEKQIILEIMVKSKQS